MSVVENVKNDNLSTVSDHEYLIEGIFTAGDVHFIGGPSGSGKTTLMFQLITDWSEGKDVFGHKSNPQPYCYIACDRSKKSIERTLKRLRLDEKIKPIISLIGLGPGITLDELLDHEEAQDSKVFFIESFYHLLPSGKGNDYKSVSKFLVAAASECQSRGITIIGSLHATKTRKDQQFIRPRERLLGSVAWAAFSETVILIEPSSADPTNNGRTILVLPRNGPAECFNYHFDPTGRLTEKCDEIGKLTLDMELSLLEFGDYITKATINQWAVKANLQTRTVTRWVNAKIEQGSLERIQRGLYCKVEGAKPQEK